MVKRVDYSDGGGRAILIILTETYSLQCIFLVSVLLFCKFTFLFCFLGDKFALVLQGQLQCFHKLISNDRIWPTEDGFEVIFEKSLFVFEILAFKVRN